MRATKINPFVWKEINLPAPCREFLFHPIRKWRFDFAWPNLSLAIEIEGGLYVQGGHVRGAMYEKNLEKYNAAAELGWLVLRYSPRGFYKNLIQIRRVYAALEGKNVA